MPCVSAAFVSKAVPFFADFQALCIAGLTPPHATATIVHARAAIVHLIEGDFKKLPQQLRSREEMTCINLACRALASDAAEEGQSSFSPLNNDQLGTIKVCIDRIEDLMQDFRQSTTLINEQFPPLNLPASNSVSASVILPLFGRLRRDTGVDHLAGEVPEPPIILPVPLTRVSERVGTFQDLTAALRCGA